MMVNLKLKQNKLFNDVGRVTPDMLCRIIPIEEKSFLGEKLLCDPIFILKSLQYDASIYDDYTYRKLSREFTRLYYMIKKTFIVIVITVVMIESTIKLMKFTVLQKNIIQLS